MQLIEALNWRYATKRFDPSRRIRTSDLEKIREVIRLTASSYGLQPYKVLIIGDHVIREELKKASWDQPQITEASHLLLFCNYSRIEPEAVDQVMEIRSKVLNAPIESFSRYGDHIKEKMSKKTIQEQRIWASKQAYIALGNVLAACGELKIDACPIEGFQPEEYDRILNLGQEGLSAAVAVAIGYRSDLDPGPIPKKIRREHQDLFSYIG